MNFYDILNRIKEIQREKENKLPPYEGKVGDCRSDYDKRIAYALSLAFKGIVKVSSYPNQNEDKNN